MIFKLFSVAQWDRGKIAVISRQHFQMHLLVWKCINLIKISLKFIPKGPFNNTPALVQIMAWCQTGNKPLSEPMMVSLHASLGLNELTSMKVYQYSSSAMAAVQIILLHMSVYFEYHHINNNAYMFHNIFYSYNDLTSTYIQCGAIITQSILSQIFTKDTP